MKKYLFMSPLRHWKNGDKKLAVGAYFVNLAMTVGAAWYVAKKVDEAYAEHPISIWTEEALRRGAL